METAAAAAATSATGASTAAPAVDHQYRPSLRLCEVKRPAKGSCGFHLSRTQWDPYPWVSGVDAGSAAEAAGLLAGDCVLEVNGEDVLGERIGAVAARVRARADKVSLLLWNAGSDPHVANSVCGTGPTPLSLQRLSSCLQAALQLLECPVCLEPASPRAVQCANGHLLCAGCRARTERCPVCRTALGPRGRCLLADQLQALLAAACQPAPRTAAAAAAAAARRKDGNSTTPAVTPAAPALQQPLVQLKSRLILPPKSSSVEDICTRKQGSTQTENGDAPAVAAGTTTGTLAVTAAAPTNAPGAPPRARSLSTGQIPNGGGSPPAPAADAPAAVTTPAPAASPAVTADAAKEEPAPELLVYCPKGADCPGTHPVSQLMQHLREAHEGPLVQYFLSGGGNALTVRAPAPGAAETVALTTAGGGTLFVCSAAAPGPARGRLLWLWALDVAAAAEAAAEAAVVALAGHSLLLKRTADAAAEPAPAPVFPLHTPWEEVLASDRCLRVEDDPLIELQVVDKLASSAGRTVSAVG